MAIDFLKKRLWNHSLILFKSLNTTDKGVETYMFKKLAFEVLIKLAFLEI